MQFLKKYAGVYLLILLLTYVVSRIGSEAYTLASTLLEPEAPKPVTVVIDPGHGGEDGGAVSCTGVCESQLNLAVGLRLNDLLNLLGIRTALTRSEDVSLHDAGAGTISQKKISDLHNRVRFVQRTPNAVLVSIHQNQYSEERYSGAQVFYAPYGDSMDLARIVQDALRTGLDPDNHRQIKESLTVYLMRKIECPGILVECGFLSNRAEEEKLRSEQYQKQLVCAIASGLTAYLCGQTGGY